ncbi:MAG: alkaline phosphatase family protein [Anaerolineae bacterium]|nr:alkaline phosphatase family protein [Anaerolineae bacterium]
MSFKKLFVIGLDCFDPTLVFDQWLDDLPNLKTLAARGVYGRLESTIPPITVPAWTCMLTGKDPGQQGFYGFRNRADYSYAQMSMATADKIRFPRVWNRVSDAGGKVIVAGVPQTFPIKPVNGIMVSSFLTPSTASAYTHPPEFRDEIQNVVGDYMLDVSDFRTNDKVRLLQNVYRMSRQRFDLVEHLLKTRSDWDFFMFVDMGPDRIHHGMWKYTDPRHPKYEANNPYQNTIRKYYQFIDERIGRLLERLPDDAAVLVMSDHGAQPMIGGICINDWLIEQGYLTLEYKPEGIVSMPMCEVDWSKTKAWGAGGYYGRLFFNVQGREPEGIIPADEVEAFKSEIIAKLEAITDLDGNMIGTRVFQPQEVYAEVNNIPPDLIVYFGDLAWRSVGTLGNEAIHTFENDTGPDDANHAQHGMFMLCPPQEGSFERAAVTGSRDRTWRAIAPTMLEMLGMDVPAEMSEERLW